MTKQAKRLLRGLTDQVQPMIDDFAAEMEPGLRAFSEEMTPILQSLAALVDDIDAYHAPERLPNGDIILRRKTPQEMEQEQQEPPVAKNEVEL